MNIEKKRGVIGTISNSKKTIREKISELNRNIGLCKKYKQETIDYTKKLENDHKRRLLRYTEYEYLLNNYLKGQPLKHWIKYYEDQETRLKEKITILKQQKPRITLEKQLASAEKKPRKDYSLYMGVIALLLIVAMPLAYYAFTNNSWITGLMISEQSFIITYHPETTPQMALGDTQTFTITTSPPENTTLSIQWYVNNMPIAGQNSETFTYTPENPGGYEIKVLVNDLQGYSTQKWDLVIDEITENLNLEENFTQSIEENLTQPVERNFTLPVEENFTQPIEENLTTLPEENIQPPAEENLTQPTEENLNEAIEQLPAEINKPVRWVKIVNNTDFEPNLIIKIPEEAINIEVKTVTITEGEELKEHVPFQETRIGEEGTSDYTITGMIVTNYAKREKKIINFLKKFFGLTGLTINAPEPLERGIIIGQIAEKYEIIYETPAPSVEETETKTGKLVRVYADIPYENITTYVNIREVSGGVNLYWITNGTRTLHDAELIDTNGNNLIDRIVWLTPHLSEQTFEIELIIIDLQSYPTIGGNWTVRFNTTGTADLTITAVNGTNWSNVNEDNDLKFLEISCGDEVLEYSWVDDSLIIENYTCSETGYEISKVLTGGVHTLEFKFGNQTAYAHNFASPNCASGCWYVQDSSGTNLVVFGAADGNLGMTGKFTQDIDVASPNAVLTVGNGDGHLIWKDSSDNIVAWVNQISNGGANSRAGDFNIIGTLSTGGGTCSGADGSSFLIHDSSGNVKLHIKSNGNMCIGGSVSADY